MQEIPVLPQQRSRSLGMRLVLATLGFCFVFTLFTVTVRTWSAWQEAWSAMNAELMLLEQVYQQTLSKAIWEMDRESLRSQVESAARVAAVGQVVLRINTGSRPPEIIEQRKPDWQTSTLAPTRQLALIYTPFPGSNESVGELTMAGDERVLWARLNKEIISIVLTQLLQSLLLAGLITLLFNRSVTIHVRHIARHLSRLTPEKLDAPLRLERSTRYGDELTLLESGVNQLQGKLLDHLAQLRRYENELAEHRDRLADLVQERTIELESLTEAQQLVLKLSNRLIHATHDHFDLCQQDCLREVAQRLGACHTRWLLPPTAGTSPGAWHLFYDWQADSPAVPPNDPPGPLTPPPDLSRLLTRLNNEETLFFPSPGEMRRQIGVAQSAASTDFTHFTNEQTGACALALLSSSDENLGLIFVGKAPDCHEWPEEDKALLAMTAQMLLHSARHKAQLIGLIAAQEALRSANRQLEELSRHDPLTGLFNRRHFDEIKEAEFRRALRRSQPLSLLVCDIDHFKAYNDHYGHAGGDQCLCAVAQAMGSQIVRSGDVLARIGGEEFAILLPATGQNEARQVAERIRRAVEDLHLSHVASKTGTLVTISIGLAELDFVRCPSFDNLFEEADQALYRAKERGRNRVESSAPEQEPDQVLA